MPTMTWFLLVLLILTIVDCFPTFERPLKVAYLHYTLQAGGVERHILNLVRSVDPARIEAYVVIVRSNTSYQLLPDISPHAEVCYFPASHVSSSGNIERDAEGFNSLVSFLTK
jgi:hypothetical protein